MFFVSIKCLLLVPIIRIRTEGPSDRSSQRVAEGWLGGSGLDKFIFLSAYAEHNPRNLRSTPGKSHMLRMYLPRPNHYPVWNSSTGFECDLIGETGVAPVTRVIP